MIDQGVGPAQRRARIDHIISCIEIARTRKARGGSSTELLGIDDWDDVGEGDEGIYILISWGSGIELICPTREVPAFEKHLAAHGEGFYSLVFGVADLDRATEHITAGERPLLRIRSALRRPGSSRSSTSRARR